MTSHATGLRNPGSTWSWILSLADLAIDTELDGNTTLPRGTRADNLKLSPWCEKKGGTAGLALEAC